MRRMPTKHGDYETNISFPVFSGYTIHVVVGDCLKKSIAARYPESDHDLSNTDAMTFRAEGGHAHIFMQTDSLYTPYKCAGVLAHEVWHAVRTMLLYVGVGGTQEGEPLNNEVVAYHLGYVVEKATKFFEEVQYDIQQCGAESKPAS